MPDEQPEIAYGFFCEYVRPETGGKITAIGMWGERCRFMSAPPGVLTNLGLHIYVVNRAQRSYPVVVRVYIPGRPDPIEWSFSLNVVSGAVGNNINMNIANLVFPQPGIVRVNVKIESTPLVEREFKMDVSFEPPGANTPAGP